MIEDKKGGLYECCPWCRKLVKLNKWIFGSLHVCVKKDVVVCDECYQRVSIHEARLLPNSWCLPADKGEVYLCQKCYEDFQRDMKDMKGMKKTR